MRTARKIMQGDLHIPDYVFSKPPTGDRANALAPACGRAAPAGAVAYPKTITIVVPTAAGGANDAMARTIAQKLGPLLGQTVIVDNRAGANGSIASEFVARAAPDGHTLMLGYIATHGMNPALQKLRYDPVTDFAPVGLVGYSPTLMVAERRRAGGDVTDLVAQLKAQPEHLCLRLGRQRHRTALRGGAVQAQCWCRDARRALQGFGAGDRRHDWRADAVHVSELVHGDPYVNAGKLRALAVAGPKRERACPTCRRWKKPASSGWT